MYYSQSLITSQEYILLQPHNHYSFNSSTNTTTTSATTAPAGATIIKFSAWSSCSICTNCRICSSWCSVVSVVINCGHVVSVAAIVAVVVVISEVGVVGICLSQETMKLCHNLVSGWVSVVACESCAWLRLLSALSHLFLLLFSQLLAPLNACLYGTSPPAAVFSHCPPSLLDQCSCPHVSFADILES